MISTSFTSLPRLPSLYIKAALKRNAKQLESLPELSLKVTGFKVDRRQLSDYLDTFGFSDKSILPAPFLYLATQSIQLYMLTLSEFPLSPAGLVHLGVQFEQAENIRSDWQGDVVMSIVNQRKSRNGLVLDIKTELLDQDGNLSVKITNTYLARAVRARNDESLPMLCCLNKETNVDSGLFKSVLSLDRSAGRQYARLSGDYNPIHLYAWSAKLFGFKKPIIHGLYMVSQAYAELHKQHNLFPSESVFQFKSPLYLPGKAELKMRSFTDRGTIQVNSSEKDHLHGQVVFS